MMCVFSVSSDDYFIRKCLWLFWWHIILFALYFEIKWEWQLRQMFHFSWIGLGFHLQPFSHCHLCFLVDELWKQVSCVIMLLLFPSSLRCMLLIGAAIMRKSTLFFLMNSEIYKCIHIIPLYILMWTFVLCSNIINSYVTCTVLKFWL